MRWTALAVTSTFIVCCAPSSSAAATVESLRKDAVRFYEEARNSETNKLPLLRKARANVLVAMAILGKTKSKTSKDEKMLLDLTALLYWINKMTPLEFEPVTTPPPTVVETGTRPDKPEPPKRTPPPPPPPRRRAPRVGNSTKYRGLPAWMDPLADDAVARFERAYVDTKEVHTCRREFFLRAFRMPLLLKKYRDRTVESAALGFQALDEYSLEFRGSSAIVMQMQAILELDRLRSMTDAEAKAEGFTPKIKKHLMSAFFTLATNPLDPAPGIVYFEQIRRAGVDHPDVLLGTALGKHWQANLASQAIVGMSGIRKESEKIGLYFGKNTGKEWYHSYRIYSAWGKDAVKNASEEAIGLFKEYAKARPRGEVYLAFCQGFWQWYYRDTKAFNSTCQTCFRNFRTRERSYAEESMVRALMLFWLRKNGHVDTKKVKW